ncbi:protein of unknown function [Serratia sp. Tan611]|nr:protein of unknown function [Serratia sp. Tan611]
MHQKSMGWQGITPALSDQHKPCHLCFFNRNSGAKSLSMNDYRDIAHTF